MTKRIALNVRHIFSILTILFVATTACKIKESIITPIPPKMPLPNFSIDSFECAGFNTVPNIAIGFTNIGQNPISCFAGVTLAFFPPDLTYVGTGVVQSPNPTPSLTAGSIAGYYYASDFSPSPTGEKVVSMTCTDTVTGLETIKTATFSTLCS